MTNESTTTKRRPRRLRMLGVIAGLLAVAAVLPAGASAKAKVVQEDVWMGYQPPIAGPFLYGGLGHSTNACRHDREIDIAKSSDKMNWDYLWHTEVSSDGGTTVYLNNSDRFNYYTITVLPKKVVKPNGQKVKCSGATLYGDAVYAS
jgi:hypothetical protein